MFVSVYCTGSVVGCDNGRPDIIQAGRVPQHVDPGGHTSLVLRPRQGI